MAMKLLAFYNQLVADFSAHGQDNNVLSLDIIQDTQVTHP
jgi:hypothetical protein